MAAHHDHRHGEHGAGTPLLQQRDAVDVGHPDVEQHEIGAEALAGGACLGGVLGHLDRMAFVGQDLREESADAEFVVDDKNGGHELSVRTGFGCRRMAGLGEGRSQLRK